MGASRAEDLALLGVSEDADEDQINSAFRKLALKWHPDKNSGRKEEAEHKFKEILAAKDRLLHPEEDIHEYDIDEILREMFGGRNRFAFVHPFHGGGFMFFGGGGFSSSEDDFPFARHRRPRACGHQRQRAHGHSSYFKDARSCERERRSRRRDPPKSRTAEENAASAASWVPSPAASEKPKSKPKSQRNRRKAAKSKAKSKRWKQGHWAESWGTKENVDPKSWTQADPEYMEPGDSTDSDGDIERLFPDVKISKSQKAKKKSNRKKSSQGPSKPNPKASNTKKPKIEPSSKSIESDELKTPEVSPRTHQSDESCESKLSPESTSFPQCDAQTSDSGNRASNPSKKGTKSSKNSPNSSKKGSKSSKNSPKSSKKGTKSSKKSHKSSQNSSVKSHVANSRKSSRKKRGNKPKKSKKSSGRQSRENTRNLEEEKEEFVSNRSEHPIRNVQARAAECPDPVEESQWSCLVCTFLNHTWIRTCEMCQIPKGVGREHVYGQQQQQQPPPTSVQVQPPPVASVPSQSSGNKSRARRRRKRSHKQVPSQPTGSSAAQNGPDSRSVSRGDSRSVSRGESRQDQPTMQNYNPPLFNQPPSNPPQHTPTGYRQRRQPIARHPENVPQNPRINSNFPVQPEMNHSGQPANMVENVQADPRQFSDNSGRDFQTAATSQPADTLIRPVQQAANRAFMATHSRQPIEREESCQPPRPRHSSNQRWNPELQRFERVPRRVDQHTPPSQQAHSSQSVSDQPPEGDTPPLDSRPTQNHMNQRAQYRQPPEMFTQNGQPVHYGQVSENVSRPVQRSQPQVSEHPRPVQRGQPRVPEHVRPVERGQSQVSEHPRPVQRGQPHVSEHARPVERGQPQIPGHVRPVDRRQPQRNVHERPPQYQQPENSESAQGSRPVEFVRPSENRQSVQDSRQPPDDLGYLPGSRDSALHGKQNHATLSNSSHPEHPKQVSHHVQNAEYRHFRAQSPAQVDTERDMWSINPYQDGVPSDSPPIQDTQAADFQSKQFDHPSEVTQSGTVDLKQLLDSTQYRPGVCVSPNPQSMSSGDIFWPSQSSQPTRSDHRSRQVSEQNSMQSPQTSPSDQNSIQSSSSGHASTQSSHSPQYEKNVNNSVTSPRSRKSGQRNFQPQTLPKEIPVNRNASRQYNSPGYTETANHTQFPNRSVNRAPGPFLNNAHGQSLNHAHGQSLNHAHGQSLNHAHGQSLNHAHGQSLNHAHGQSLN
eukprot:851555_1